MIRQNEQDNLIGVVMGMVGGAAKFYLTIPSDFFIRFAEAGLTALFCGAMGVAGKELWYGVRRKIKRKKNETNLAKNRTGRD